MRVTLAAHAGGAAHFEAASLASRSLAATAHAGDAAHFEAAALAARSLAATALSAAAR